MVSENLMGGGAPARFGDTRRARTLVGIAEGSCEPGLMTEEEYSTVFTAVPIATDCLAGLVVASVDTVVLPVAFMVIAVGRVKRDGTRRGVNTGFTVMDGTRDEFCPIEV